MVFRIRTSGPHEFYSDSKGKRKVCGHQTPVSEEAEEQGLNNLLKKRSKDWGQVMMMFEKSIWINL